MRAPMFLLASLFLASCSDDGAPSFLGTWQFAPGSLLDVTCSDGTHPSGMPTDVMTFVAGTDADLVRTAPECDVKFDVDDSGLVATVVPGQTCTYVQGTEMATSAFDEDTLTFEDGVLMLLLPKTPDAKPKQIKVEPHAQLTRGTAAH